LSKLYKKSGVDVIKTDNLIYQALKFIKTTHNHKVLGNKLGFSAEYKVNKDVTLCSATDGVGTKAILAAELNSYKGIGQDLLAMCSNDLLCNKATPLFFLDYFACNSVIPKQYTEILKSLTKACKKINCSLIGGETAEMPSLYHGNHFDMAGFLVGLKNKQKFEQIKSGDLIIGIKSNGFHSNGYSLIRKIISDNKINLKSAKFNKKKLSDVLMKPTRLYHQLVNTSDLKKIKSLAHITGGGVIANFKRSISKKIKFSIDVGRLPDEYKFIEDNLKISKKELQDVFNCGIGMTIITNKKNYNYFIRKTHFKLIGEIE
jgi:phosphoribosylformylglycinamidine cyclo-ligase